MTEFKTTAPCSKSTSQLSIHVLHLFWEVENHYVKLSGVNTSFKPRWKKMHDERRTMRKMKLQGSPQLKQQDLLSAWKQDQMVLQTNQHPRYYRKPTAKLTGIVSIWTKIIFIECNKELPRIIEEKLQQTTETNRYGKNHHADRAEPWTESTFWTTTTGWDRTSRSGISWRSRKRQWSRAKRTARSRR